MNPGVFIVSVIGFLIVSGAVTSRAFFTGKKVWIITAAAVLVIGLNLILFGITFLELPEQQPSAQHERGE